jgi:hypothetical protein
MVIIGNCGGIHGHDFEPINKAKVLDNTSR